VLGSSGANQPGEIYHPEGQRVTSRVKERRVSLAGRVGLGWGHQATSPVLPLGFTSRGAVGNTEKKTGRRKKHNKRLKIQRM